MNLRNSIIGILLFFAIFSVPEVRAQDGLRGGLSIGVKSASFANRSTQITAADFDNDQKPDAALLQEAGFLNGERTFRIEIHVTAGTNNAITFSSDEPSLAIAALDVNRDGAPDIVIEKAFTHERLKVYLNDGHGSFHKVRTEDYPSSDPMSPAWRVRLNQLPPIFGLPVSRGLEIGGCRETSVFLRNLSSRLRIWCEGLVIQSAARAPSPSRAPPSISL